MKSPNAARVQAVEGRVDRSRKPGCWLEKIEIEEKKIGMTQSVGLEIVFFADGGGREEIADIDVEWEPSGSGRQN